MFWTNFGGIYYEGQTGGIMMYNYGLDHRDYVENFWY